MISNREAFLSVDVEMLGRIPGEYSLLTIGACDVSDSQKNTFSCELKPTTRNADPKALEVTGLSLGRLECDGLEPATAMQKFRNWILSTAGNDATPVFAGPALKGDHDALHDAQYQAELFRLIQQRK